MKDSDLPSASVIRTNTLLRVVELNEAGNVIVGSRKTTAGALKSGMQIVANDITNATTAGKALLTAADLAAQKALLGIPYSIAQCRSLYVDTYLPNDGDGSQSPLDLENLTVPIQPGEAVAYHFQIFGRLHTSTDIHVTIGTPGGSQWVRQIVPEYIITYNEVGGTDSGTPSSFSIEFMGVATNSGGSVHLMYPSVSWATADAADYILASSMVTFARVPIPSP